VKGFLIKKARFSSKIERPKLLLELTGEGSQPAGTFGAHRGARYIKVPLIIILRVFTSKEYEASNCWIRRKGAPKRG